MSNECRAIIAGGRDITDSAVLDAALAACPWTDEITNVICGDARGIDFLGAAWASQRGISVTHFPADWRTYGKSAGPRRNELMVEVADALIAVWDEESRGTADMIRRAKAHGLRLFVYSTLLDAEWKPVVQAVARAPQGEEAK